MVELVNVLVGQSSQSRMVGSVRVIGLGIVFCAAAVVHNVFVWQKVSKHSKRFIDSFFFLVVCPIFSLLLCTYLLLPEI